MLILLWKEIRHIIEDNIVARVRLIFGKPLPYLIAFTDQHPEIIESLEIDVGRFVQVVRCYVIYASWKFP